MLKARGYMASWLIKNKINKNDDIKKFSEEGYKFSAQNPPKIFLFFLEINFLLRSLLC